ncbi:MAG: hypothetical protein RL308_1206 [Bacteroidota bacterium]|jgi:predicted ATP-grasp superfamily ATP-dependent carboligase
MTNLSKTILISGARAPIALEMARSFHKAGHRVIMIDCLHLTIARWSNCVSTYYVIPSPRFDNLGFVAKIQEIIRVEQVDHFIPTCEEAIFVAEHLESFLCKVWTADHKLILELHNKLRFAQFNHSGFPIPTTFLIREFMDWDNSDKYVFKPVYSRFASSVIIRKQLSNNFFKDTDKNHWIAQDFITGKEICIYSIWNEGRLKAYSAYHPLYRAGKGAGIFFEPIKNDLVFEYVKTIGSQIKYTGQLCFDVIIDVNETPYFIECNPRGTSGAHLINTQLAEAFLGTNTYVGHNNQEFSIKYVMFFLHFIPFFKKRVWKSKDIIFQWNDLKPFIFQILSLIEITYIKFTKRVSWLEATTFNIEWNENKN